MPWVSHYVDILRGEQFKPEFLALNPKAVVPVLVHDGAVIVESTVICEYVEEVFPAHPIYPDIAARARAGARVDQSRRRGAASRVLGDHLRRLASAHDLAQRRRQLRGLLGARRRRRHGGAQRKWQWIQHGLEAPGAADKIRLYDSYLHKMERRAARRRLAGRRAIFDGRHRDGAVCEPARCALDEPGCGSTAGCRVWRAGSSECVYGRRLRRPSLSGCRLSSPLKCARTVARRGLRSPRCSKSKHAD